MAINENMLELGKKLADAAIEVNKLNREFGLKFREFGLKFAGNSEISDQDYEDTHYALQAYEESIAVAAGFAYNKEPRP